MAGGAQRLADGLAWERQVSAGLTGRGYDVDPFGLGLLTDRAKGALRGRAPVLRWMPDLIVRSGDDVVFVDAKGGWRYRETGRHDIEESSAWAAAEWENFAGLPVWFVFRDGRCATPSDVLSVGVAGRITSNGSGTPFLLIPTSACRPVADVFPIITKGA